jgi:hypothetical protein
MTDEPEDHSPEGSLVTIREYLYPIQAEWAHNVLASVGIACTLPDSHADYLASLVKGVRVQVAQENAGEAESVLGECEFEMGAGQTREHLAEYAAEGEIPDDAEPTEQFEPQEGAPDVADLGDLAAGLAPKSCPQCAQGKARPTPPPEYAAESLLSAFLKRLAGRGWYRCPACGHIWETGPGQKREEEPESLKDVEAPDPQDGTM